ncbi:MAG TPA: hypothetical protein VM656_01670, partial [Pyrinomonadaceae bacterium]|nr:hypothetical protein [Pyrinomonadaceae bacterium]
PPEPMEMADESGFRTVTFTSIRLRPKRMASNSSAELTPKALANFSLELTPKALANFSPGLERERQPWDQNNK